MTIKAKGQGQNSHNKEDFQLCNNFESYAIGRLAKQPRPRIGHSCGGNAASSSQHARRAADFSAGPRSCPP